MLSSCTRRNRSFICCVVASLDAVLDGSLFEVESTFVERGCENYMVSCCQTTSKRFRTWGQPVPIVLLDLKILLEPLLSLGLCKTIATSRGYRLQSLSAIAKSLWTRRSIVASSCTSKFLWRFCGRGRTLYSTVTHQTFRFYLR